MIESHRPHLPGQRPVKAESSRFTYSGQDVIDAWWGDGSPRAEFYHGNGETVAKRLFDRNGHFEPGGVISPHENYLYLNHDALGSVSGMTDRLGQQVMRYRQDAFGAPMSGTLEPYNTQLLTEKGFDTTSGLYYFGSRWYDPGVGRFMNQDSYRGTASEPMSQHRYAYVHNNPANLIDEWGYNAQWKPQPHNVALDGLMANVRGGGDMFMNYSQQLSGRVGARIGGMASGTYNGIVGAAQWVAADPWRAAGTAVVAAAITVGVVMTAPVSVPAIITGAGTLATNFVTSQAISLGVGAAVDAAALINPSLGEAASYVQRGVQIYQAATSLAGGIGSLSTFDMTSLASFSGVSDASSRLSSITGNASYLLAAAGNSTPWLSEVSQVTGYLGMAKSLAPAVDYVASATLDAARPTLTAASNTASDFFAGLQQSSGERIREAGVGGAGLIPHNPDVHGESVSLTRQDVNTLLNSDAPGFVRAAAVAPFAMLGGAAGMGLAIEAGPAALGLTTLMGQRASVGLDRVFGPGTSQNIADKSLGLLSRVVTPGRHTGVDNVSVTSRGIEKIENHLFKTPGISAGAPEKLMIQRLLNGERTPVDLRFFQHETLEARILSVIRGAYRDPVAAARKAHELTTQRQGIKGRNEELYSPEANQLIKREYDDLYELYNKGML